MLSIFYNVSLAVECCAAAPLSPGSNPLKANKWAGAQIFAAVSQIFYQCGSAKEPGSQLSVGPPPTAAPGPVTSTPLSSPPTRGILRMQSGVKIEFQCLHIFAIILSIYDHKTATKEEKYKSIALSG